MKVKSVLFGIAVALVGIALDVGTARLFNRFWTAEVIGNSLTGVLAGFAMFKYMAHRIKLSKQRSAQIAYLNHHIHNALEAIVLSHYTGDDVQRLRIVSDASERINETLARFTKDDRVSLDVVKDDSKTPERIAKRPI